MIVGQKKTTDNIYDEFENGLHSDALRRADGDLIYLMFQF